MHLARRHYVHVRCFAKSDAEVADAEALKPHCASVVAHKLSSLAAPAALIRFALGDCLNTSYYNSAALRRDVLDLCEPHATLSHSRFCTVMAPFAPADVPLILEQVDVDRKSGRNMLDSTPIRVLCAGRAASAKNGNPVRPPGALRFFRHGRK